MPQTDLATVKSLGTILTVWAHPDDETFTAGGLLAQAVQNGQTVVCATATKGEGGVQDAERWPPEQLGDIRSTELAKALEILGVSHHHWLGYRDGGCQTADSDEAADKVRELINTYKPDTIITFGPDGLTGHPDHQAVSSWVSRVAHGSDIRVLHAVQLRDHYQKMRAADEKFNIFFNLEQPNFAERRDCALILQLPAELLDRKYRALSAMPSQYGKMFAGLSRDQVYEMFSVEAFRSAVL